MYRREPLDYSCYLRDKAMCRLTECALGTYMEYVRENCRYRLCTKYLHQGRCECREPNKPCRYCLERRARCEGWDNLRGPWEGEWAAEFCCDREKKRPKKGEIYCDEKQREFARCSGGLRQRRPGLCGGLCARLEEWLECK